MNKILSHSGFQPLKEVWLGDCYPQNFYDHFESQERDFFYEITERTKNDLQKVHTLLENLNIVVRRPEFVSIDAFVDFEDNLCKPPICPRDWAMTLNDTLYICPQYASGVEPWAKTITEYIDHGQKVKILDRSLPDPMAYLGFPSTVRVGKDIHIDIRQQSGPAYEYFMTAAQELAQQYRVHITHTGDHNDGIFCPIRPGQIFSTHYRQHYSKSFPGWDVFFLPDTTKKRYNYYPGSWWVPGMDYQIFNSSVVKKAQSWIGDATETVFEVNMLVIDEKNVVCIAEDDAACRRMEQLGITPHVVDFSTRGFWDGGIHCITVDICREGDCEDYWPERGDPGIYK